MSLISITKRYLEDNKPSYNIFKLGTILEVKLESNLYNVLIASGISISQAVANKLSSFSIYYFTLVAIS
jgi:hypothetical protein